MVNEFVQGRQKVLIFTSCNIILLLVLVSALEVFYKKNVLEILLAERGG